MNIQRRRFLKSGFAWGALGFNLANPLFLNRQALAQTNTSPKKLLFIFQRGGNDAINAVIPRGDSDYNNTNRPSLFIPESRAIDTGNGFAQFHPMLEPMMEIYNHTSLNGVEGPGNLAVIHRVGYSNQSRSHFDSQDFWENGDPGNTGLKEGIFYRRLARQMDLTDPSNAFVAASISGSQLLSLKGSNPFPNFLRAGSFGLQGSDEENDSFLGSRPNIFDRSGRGIRGLYGGEPSLPGGPYADLVQRTGQSLAENLETVQGALEQGGYQPENGAVYPDGGFGNKLQEAAMLMKRTDVRILG
ncbi:MAG: hypothetical protein AAF514_09985, partial [Verrucomicrobiota bacterium]